MSASGDKALLPAGLGDGLPPAAATESRSIERLIAAFEGQGYERVKPPLIEFEETLLAGAGADLAPQTFRLMDPVSQRMMGLRADMTPQVARIAATRLARQPRPLRLCYAGQVLRVRGTQLRPERQFAQVGAELIGHDSPAADAEVILLSAEALLAAGAQGLTVDLTLPTLVTLTAEALGFTADEAHRLRDLLDRKDAAGVAAAAGGHGALFEALLEAAGPVQSCLARLRALDLPQAAKAEIYRLEEVAALVGAAQPELALTADPSEHKGFEYQTGLSFTIFGRGVRGELGRGGRYQAEPASDGAASEAATGFTLFMDTVLRALPPGVRGKQLYLPYGVDPATARELRAEGWTTVAALAPEENAEDGPAGEARRLGCAAWLAPDGVRELKDE